MKIDWSYLKIVGASYTLAALLTYYPISEYTTEQVVQSIVAGIVISVLNLLAGYFAIEYAFEKSHTTFLKFVLGGMVGRLMLMWLTLVILLKGFEYHPASLMLTLLLFYSINLVLEVYFLQKKVTLKSNPLS